MVRLSRRIPLAVSLSLNFCLFETSERISFARESREKEENARSRINLLFLSFSLRVDLRSALRAFTLALVRETVVRAKMMTRVWLFREGGTRTERADLDETHNVFARERRLFAGGVVVWVVVGLRALMTFFL